MQATEPQAAGPLLDRLRTFVDRLSESALTRARDNTVEPDPTVDQKQISVEEMHDDLEAVELPDEWQEIDLEEAGIR